MSMKYAAVFITIIVYCMTLLAFNQHREIDSRRYERLSRRPILGWNLAAYVGGLNGAMDRGRWDLAQAAKDAPSEEKVESFDPVLAQTIRDFNQVLPTEEVEKLARLIEGTANMYGVDPYLVAALVSQESAFYQTAVSPVGALGLGQLMPETAKELGVDPRDGEENLDGCVRYLAQNLERWAHTKDPVTLALASYNAGPGAVQRYGGVPPYQETQNYVVVIKYRYDLLCSTRKEA